MPRLKLFALTGSLCLMSLISYRIVGFSQSPQSAIRLTTNPPLEQLISFEAEAEINQSPARLTLQAVDALGQPLENVKIRL